MNKPVSIIGQRRVKRPIFRLTRNDEEVNLSATVGPGWGNDGNFLGVVNKADLPQRNQTAVVPVYPVRGGIKGQPRQVVIADMEGSLYELEDGDPPARVSSR